MPDPKPQLSLLAETAAPAPFLNAVVERVTFQNEESGYSILRVRVEHGKIESWVGPAPTVREGQPVKARGVVTVDPKWGPQRRCDAILPVMPTDAAGIEAYLGGGILPGVGPAMAKRIVAKFGPQTLEVIAQRPRDLLQVTGLGETKLDAIIKAWPDIALDAEIMSFLASIGAPPSISAKIVKRYKGETMAVLTKAPYRLALEVSGIGFKTADQIARAVGIPLDSPQRAQAAVLHVINEQTTRGDCYVPREMLADKTVELLGPGCAEPLDAIQFLATTSVRVSEDRPPASRIVAEAIGDAAILYPRNLWEAEVSLASSLRYMLGDSGEPLPGAEQAIAEFERESGLVLGEDQRRAVFDAAHKRVVIITGGAGTGKTAVTKAILAVFDKAKLKTALMSPTGRAAKRLSEATGRTAATIHRTLGIPVSKDDRRFARGGFMHSASNPLPVDAVCCDEFSMADVVLANAVVQALPPKARLVIVGDFNQLPSVGPGAVLRDLITSGVVPTTRLTRIFRQTEGSQIIAQAAAVNNGHMPRGPTLDQQATGAEFYVEPMKDGKEAAALIVQHVSQTIPVRFGYDAIRDVQVLTPMNKGACGTIELNAALQAALNPRGADHIGVGVTRGRVVFRVGDPVMQTKNDYALDVFNGEKGFVVSVNEDDKTIRVDIDGRIVPYAKDDLDNLMLAYACSIHRSQGSTIKAVVMAMLPEHFMMLSRNLLYTGLSRASHLCVLVADNRSLAMAVRETKKETRRTRLVDRLKGGFMTEF